MIEVLVTDYSLKYLHVQQDECVRELKKAGIPIIKVFRYGGFETEHCRVCFKLCKPSELLGCRCDIAFGYFPLEEIQIEWNQKKNIPIEKLLDFIKEVEQAWPR